MPTNTSVNNWGTTKFVVSGDPSVGNYTTIQSAIDNAPSGSTIVIREGTYTEDLTLGAGITLTSYDRAQVTIVGNVAAFYDGTTYITGITLAPPNAVNPITMNMDAVFSNPTLYVENCNIVIDGAEILVSDPNGELFINNSTISGTPNPYLIEIQNNTSLCTISNSSILCTNDGPILNVNKGSLTLDHCSATTVVPTLGAPIESTVGSATLILRHCSFDTPLLTTGVSLIQAYHSNFNAAKNFDFVPFQISASNANSLCDHCYISGKDSACMSIFLTTSFTLLDCTLDTSSTNAIIGTGTLNAGPLQFVNGFNVTPSIVQLICGPGANFSGNVPAGVNSLTLSNTDTLNNTSLAVFTCQAGDGTTNAGDAVFNSRAGTDGGGNIYSWGMGTMGGNGNFLIMNGFNGFLDTSAAVIIPPGTSRVRLQYGWSIDGTNTCNSYVEGTFVPNLTFGGGSTGITYLFQNAQQFRIGNTVFYQINIGLSSKGTDVGIAYIDNLFYTPSSQGIGSMIYSDITLTAGATQLNAFANPATTQLYFYESGSAFGASPIDDTAFTNNSQLIITGSYFMF